MKKLKLILNIIFSIIELLLGIIGVSGIIIIQVYPTDIKNTNLFKIYLIVCIMLVVITILLKPEKILKNLKRQIYSLGGIFDWQPTSQLNSGKVTKLIQMYPKDFKLNFNPVELELRDINGKKDLVLIQGIDAFSQAIIKFVNTPKNTY